VIRTLRFLLVGCLAALPASRGIAADEFKLVDGDRVVLVGNTLIEREQRYGSWEAALTSRFPGVTFRNLGWSGDNVFGLAQASFGTVADGFKHRKEHVEALKPTVILVGYGSNEAFDGAAGLPRFREGLTALLDSLAQTKARLVLLAPLRQEDLGRPLPDPAEQNKNLELYRAALREEAQKRGCPFVDLYDLVPDGSKAKPPAPLTDNGIHLTAYGYWRSAASLEKGLGLKPPAWSVEIDTTKRTVKAEGTTVVKDTTNSMVFRLTDDRLPAPPAPKDSPKGAALPDADRVLRVTGLRGPCTLLIDGKPIPDLSLTAEKWAAGVKIPQGPEFDQAEQLRQKIVEKNQLYFHRWRPANETYLFGFRKNEQGQNAVEIPKFDPLVEKAEQEIAKLRVPVVHTYTISPVPE
jgi:lysophospholipase L1-like esterase